jgi:CRP-like cAMP-binding protein
MRRRRARLSPLAGIAPFDRCRPKALAPLSAHVDKLRVPQGTVLAHEGWTVRELLVVLAGEVVATHEGRVVHRFQPGAQIGAAELLSGTTHPATLVAGAGLEILIVNGPAYRWAVQALPGLRAP